MYRILLNGMWGADFHIKLLQVCSMFLEVQNVTSFQDATSSTRNLLHSRRLCQWPGSTDRIVQERRLANLYTLGAKQYFLGRGDRGR